MKLKLIIVLCVLFLLNIVSCGNLSAHSHLNAHSPNCSCLTEACQLFGESLEKHMNLSANPCQDFHEYSCGNWKPKKDTEKSPFAWDNDSLLTKIDLILQKEKATPSKSNSKAVRYVIDMYHECLDVRTREQLGMEPIQVLFKQVFESDESLDEHHSNLSNQNENSIEVNYSSKLLKRTLTKPKSTRKSYETTSPEQDFRVSFNNWIKSRKLNTEFNADPNDVAQWMDIFVETSLIGVHLNEQIFDFDDLQISLNFPATEDLNHLFTVFKHLVFTLFDAAHRIPDQSIFEVLYFYKELDEIYNRKYIKFEGNLIIRQNITLGELNAYYSSDQFDWILLLNKFASRADASFRFTEEDIVGVGLDELHVLKPLTQLIANTPIRVLSDSIAMQILSDTRVTSLLLNEKLNPKINDKQHRWACLNQNLNIFSAVFTRLFVDQLGREQIRTARDYVIKMSVQVKETFRDSLQHEHAWLDEQTRQSAQDKLNAIKFDIGFPDWIFEDDALDEEYGFDIFSNDEFEDSLRTFKGRYAEGYLNLVRLLNGAKFRNTEIINKREFHFYLNGEGLYDPNFNLVELSVSLLTEPVFNVDYPVEIIYGRIGFVIGHEIIHAFGETYRLFDKHGNTVNWWTDSASKYFDYLSKCFVFKYNGLVEPITGFELNGTQTLDENIADNGGLRQAYRTFEHNLKHSTNCNSIPQKTSPFLAQFTPEQLFFISYSTSYCGFYPENSTDQMYYHFQVDTHSPDMLRVNVPLASMDQFAQAFNCPVGSRMNPVHKCVLW